MCVNKCIDTQQIGDVYSWNK